MVSIGTILFINVPLLPDYVQKDSIGLANAITATVMATNNFFTGTVILKVASNISDQGYIYYAISLYMILTGMLMLYGIKDV